MGSNGRQQFLGRIFGRLRGDARRNMVDKTSSVAVITETSSCNTNFEEDGRSYSTTNAPDDPENNNNTSDFRYSGQYLTPEQLPAFCDQLSNLIKVIQNIKSYQNVTREYPRELERRLEWECREVCALAAEARNARDTIARTCAQRRALREEKKCILAQLDVLKDTETRELENMVRTSDRKLFKCYEVLKDTKDPEAFDALIDEIKAKQTALDCLMKLIDSRKASISRKSVTRPPNIFESRDDSADRNKRRQDILNFRRGIKRRRPGREPRSMPVSNEPSNHRTDDQEGTSRYRVEDDGTVTLTVLPLELHNRLTARDETNIFMID